MRKLVVSFLAVAVFLSFFLSACAPAPVIPTQTVAEQQQQAAAEQLSEEARSAANLNGPSIEARNVAERIKRTNLPGQVGFIYLVSPYTGDILLKATFVGKPTSTSKRLDPPQNYEWLHNVDCGEAWCSVALEYDAVAADGTWGSSMAGIFWFDTAGQMMEVRGDAALIIILERPYIFDGNNIDMTVDVRLQSDQVDAALEAQAQAVQEYLIANPDFELGDPIPLAVLVGAGDEDVQP